MTFEDLARFFRDACPSDQLGALADPNESAGLGALQQSQSEVLGGLKEPKPLRKKQGGLDQ